MDLSELLFIAFEAFLAGICWTFGGMLAEAIADRVFPPDHDDVEPTQDPPKSQPPPRTPKRKPRLYARASAVLPALAIVLGGCAASGCTGCSAFVKEGQMVVPNYPQTEVICRMSSDCDIWAPAKVGQALDAWVVLMGDWFDISPKIPYVILIEGTSDLGPAGPDVQKTAGKTLNPTTIQIAGLYLYGNTPRPMGRSAFSHELLHVALWNMGDPDYNHATPPGPWTKFHDQALEEFDNALLRAFPEADAGFPEDTSHE